jgi:hypothetical protein
MQPVHAPLFSWYQVYYLFEKNTTTNGNNIKASLAHVNVHTCICVCVCMCFFGGGFFVVLYIDVNMFSFVVSTDCYAKCSTYTICFQTSKKQSLSLSLSILLPLLLHLLCVVHT